MFLDKSRINPQLANPIAILKADVYSSMHALLLAFLIDAGIQFLFWLLSSIFATEKLFDLSGALTFHAIAITLLLIDPRSWRQVAAAIGVCVWAARLGGFLFLRVLRLPDRRFDALKTPVMQLVPFSAQIVWIFLTLLSLTCLMAEQDTRGFMWSDAIGAIVFIGGLVFETVADAQKYQFKKEKPSDFVSTGVWRYSRYANYFGELTVWLGMFVFCAGGYAQNWQYVSVVSPVFVFVLLWFGSGIALSEKNAQLRYGQREDYQEYVRVTSKFVPWPPGSRI